MARRFLSGLGPTFNSLKLSYNDGSNGALPNGHSIVTTSGSGKTPTNTGWFVKVTAASGPATGEELNNSRSWSPNQQDYGWLVIRDFVIEGTLTAATNVPGQIWVPLDTGDMTVTFEGVTSTTYKVKVATQGNSTITSSTTFSRNVKRTLRVEINPSNVILWVDGTQEGSVANSANRKIRMHNAWAAVKTASGYAGEGYFAGIMVCDSDSQSDRPGIDVEVERLDANADWGSEQDYGDENSCGATDAVYTDVTLSGDAESLGTHWCDSAAAIGNQMCEVENLALPTHDIEGIVTASVSRSQSNSKVVATKHRISDGSTRLTKAVDNLPDTTWRGRRMAWADPPSGTWNARINATSDLKMGIRGDSGNSANDQHGAFVAECFGVDDDPPPTAAGRRRGFAQVV